MEGIRQYVLTVICAVFLCGIALCFVPDAEKKLVQFVSGLIVTITALTPVLKSGDFSLDLYLGQISADSRWAVSTGQIAATETTSAFIKEKTESYILNKAAELGAQIDVDVSLTDDNLPVPDEITVCGVLSPYAKKQLSDQIRNDLGIEEDNQIWIS